MSFDDLRHYTEDFLTASVHRMAQELDPAVPAFLVGHATVSTAMLGSERSLMIGNDYTLLPTALHDPRFDYVALGHVHHHQVLAERPPIVYAGSLHRVDFAEEDETKGFCLIEIDAERPQGQRLLDWRFQPVWARPLLTVDVALSPDDLDPTATVLAALSRHDVADAIVRVDVRLPGALEGQVDPGRIRQALSGAHMVAGVNLHVDTDAQTRTRLERGMAVERLSPMDALGLYLDSRKTDSARRATLLRHAAAIIDDTLGTPGASPDRSNGPPSDAAVRIADANDMDDAFAVRRRVFIDEQGVDPDLEWDGRDADAVHAVAVLDGEIIGTGRLLVAAAGAEAHIGRMAVLPEHRRRGVGGRILEALEDAARQRGAPNALLHAQTYVKDFYADRGYREEGETFQEAGIDHIVMRKQLAPGEE